MLYCHKLYMYVCICDDLHFVPMLFSIYQKVKTQKTNNANTAIIVRTKIYG